MPVVSFFVRKSILFVVGKKTAILALEIAMYAKTKIH